MSHTVHHRKPGAPRKPGKGHIPEGRIVAAFRRGHFEDLPAFEPTANRRTR